MILKKLSEVEDLQEKLADAEAAYKYQKKLTEVLDEYQEDFTELHVLKIILWKLNRYPQITTEHINLLNNLKHNYSENSAKKCILCLLNIKGLDLPMVSTILRFLMPNKFQIIDQRAYRILYGADLKLSGSNEEKVKLYLEYLHYLQQQCEKLQIIFNKADRLLYSLDKDVNKGLPLKNYGSQKMVHEE
jgi:thermostable 8-oxoguanine DNA glycosylase